MDTSQSPTSRHRSYLQNIRAKCWGRITTNALVRGLQSLANTACRYRPDLWLAPGHGIHRRDGEYKADAVLQAS